MDVASLEGIYLKGLELQRARALAAVLTDTQGVISVLPPSVGADLFALLVSGRFASTATAERGAVAARAQAVADIIAKELSALGVTV